ncbi:MAG: RES family NAD+ phosphorylase [Steroidobacteraceae bacterium]|nr:RES family NAD+ phosphorylase [Steroidobacteraceae bacterium]
MTTWTPPALASSARRYQRALWRVVEAQHTASTMRLADSLAEQALLEGILEASKPPLAAGTERLHYLLATPFRYRPHAGSRFRAPFEGGVWYGAEHLRTALAEKSYWRLRFLLDSPGTPDLKPVPHTAFVATVRGTAIDLTAPPLDADRATWTRRNDYRATQALATAAREANIELIRYESVRDPEHAACVVALTPAVFGRGKPRQRETWFVAASRERVRCVIDARGGATWEFAARDLL